jgi:hypothetical protein
MVKFIDELPVFESKLLKSRVATQADRNRTYKTKPFFQSRNALCVFRDSQLILV